MCKEYLWNYKLKHEPKSGCSVPLGNSISLCFQTMVLEKTLESPLDSKEIKPVDPSGNQP